MLSLDAYRRIGGVSGALARRAEKLFSAMNEEGRDACRQLFLRLVTVGEGGEETRRRVRRSELADLADARAMEGVIESFGRHRLLSFDRDPDTREPTVEIAHEALLRAWERLRGWIDDAREELRQRARVSSANAGMDRRRSGARTTSLSGIRLAQAEEASEGHGPAHRRTNESTSTPASPTEMPRCEPNGCGTRASSPSSAAPVHAFAASSPYWRAAWWSPRASRPSQ